MNKTAKETFQELMLAYPDHYDELHAMLVLEETKEIKKKNKN